MSMNPNIFNERPGKFFKLAFTDSFKDEHGDYNGFYRFIETEVNPIFNGGYRFVFESEEGERHYFFPNEIIAWNPADLAVCGWSDEYHA